MSNLAIKVVAPRTRKVILVTSNKGGTGKTTTSVNLAVAAAHEGWDVGAIDLDTQHSFDNWSLRRKKYAAAQPPVAVYRGQLSHYKTLLGQTDGHEIVIIDTPPGVKENIDAIRGLIELADFVLVPTQTGIFDLDSTIPWIQSIQPSKNDKVAFILNRVNMRSTETREAHSLLVKKGRVCGVSIRDLTSIQRSMKTGHSVVDMNNPLEKGKQDYQDVWSWIEREVSL